MWAGSNALAVERDKKRGGGLEALGRGQALITCRGDDFVEVRTFHLVLFRPVSSPHPPVCLFLFFRPFVKRFAPCVPVSKVLLPPSVVRQKTHSGTLYTGKARPPHTADVRACHLTLLRR